MLPKWSQYFVLLFVKVNFMLLWGMVIFLSSTFLLLFGLVSSTISSAAMFFRQNIEFAVAEEIMSGS